MSVRNDDNIIKSLVILAVCIVAMLMVCTECALLPQYGWLWLILLLILAIAAVFSVVMGIKTWLDEHGRTCRKTLVRHMRGTYGAFGTSRPRRNTDHRAGQDRHGHGMLHGPFRRQESRPRMGEDVVPSLPQAIWVEFMGIDEKPDSDDYEIAVDLVAGDFYYSPNLKDDGNRKGFALCVQHLTDYIASQMDEKKSHD